MVLARASPILEAVDAAGELVLLCTGVVVLCLSISTLSTGTHDYNSFILSLNPKEVVLPLPYDEDERYTV